MKKLLAKFLVIISLVALFIPTSSASAATVATFRGLGGSTYTISDRTYVGYGYQTEGMAVEVLQAALTVLNYNPGRIDNQFGKNTNAALSAFQLYYLGYQDGIAGPQTFSKLGQLCAGKTLQIHPL